MADIKYTDVMTIVRRWLADNGYDGLYNTDGECSCLRSNLAPCAEGPLPECGAGYRHEGCKEWCGMGCDWHIAPEKP